MWKYVSRRVKDTLERTCNVIDVGRTSFCSSSGVTVESPCVSVQAVEPEPRKNDCRMLLYRKRGGCMGRFREHAGRFSGKDEERAERERHDKERLNHQEKIAQSWWSALTWSSAIVCGWYTSQYMCLRRKRLGWTPMERPAPSCLYANLLMTTTRSLHSNVTSRIAFAAPPIPSSSSSVGEEAIHPSIGALLHNVNNPEVGPEKRKRSTSSFASNSSSQRSKSDRSSSSLDSAVAEFSFTIGEIEYQFAVQDLLVENFKSAVDHLKLATTHHHPAATFNLGLCYEKGLGVDKDLRMASQCYSLASALGHTKAMYNLGVFYVRGLGGLRRSKKAARECFDSAARLGQREAQLALELRQEKELQRRGMEPKLMSAVHAF